MVKTKEEAVSILKEIFKIIKLDFDIKEAYLFGSFATGTNDESSDIDAGVVIKEDLDFSDKLKIFSKAQEKNNLVELFAFSEKDFEIVSSDIIHEIKNRGIRVL